MLEANRLVAFFDILGFKALVHQLPLSELVRRFGGVFQAVYAAAARDLARSTGSPERVLDLPNLDSDQLSREAIPQFTHHTGINAFVMSDSLVLYSDPLVRPSQQFDDQLVRMALVCRTISLRLFENFLPARGALAFGEFHADPTSQIFVGRALVEAYSESENQEWIGTVIAEALSEDIERLICSPQEYIERLSSAGRWDLLRRNWDVLRYPVPTKTGDKERWVINWVSGWNAGGPVRDDYFSGSLTGSDRVDRKYANTLKLMQAYGETIEPV